MSEAPNKGIAELLKSWGVRSSAALGLITTVVTIVEKKPAVWLIAVAIVFLTASFGILVVVGFQKRASTLDDREIIYVYTPRAQYGALAGLSLLVMVSCGVVSWRLMHRPPAPIVQKLACPPPTVTVADFKAAQG